jgi:phosphopentomutase
VYENIDNSGNEYPDQRSIFQEFRKQMNLPDSCVYIIASKDKLHVLNDCNDPAWKGKWMPKTLCGINGQGYEEDEVTLAKAIEAMNKNRPRLMLVQFKEPDVTAHGGLWNNYLQEIKHTDQLLGQLWNAVEQNAFYKDNTTLIVTNDHGRHTEGWLDGFVSHGDGCEGCRHINFLAIGPKIKENYLCKTAHDQTDIAPTIAAILGFDWKQGSGSVMNEIMN